MKTMPRKWILTLIALLACIFVVWGVGKTSPQGMSSQQQMKKMMMNAPKDSKEAMHLVMEVKRQEMAEGKYKCCLHHSCSWCALHTGACTCYSHAASGRPVCDECKGGWSVGDGRVPGKTASEIKAMPRST